MLPAVQYSANPQFELINFSHSSKANKIRYVDLYELLPIWNIAIPWVAGEPKRQPSAVWKLASHPHYRDGAHKGPKPNQTTLDSLSICRYSPSLELAPEPQWRATFEDAQVSHIKWCSTGM